MPAKATTKTTAKTAKRKTTSSSSSSSSAPVTKRASLDVTRAVERAMRDFESLNKNMEKNVQSFEASTGVLTDTFLKTLRDADQQIEDRQRQYSELQDKIAYETRQGRIKVDQDLAQYGLSEAKKILSNHNMEAIDSTELRTLRSDLATARQGNDDELRKAVADAIAKEKTIHASIQSRTKAECALELAQTKASLESKDVIIDNLNERIARNEDDIRAARELTRQVSEAASRSAVNINTTSGK